MTSDRIQDPVDAAGQLDELAGPIPGWQPGCSNRPRPSPQVVTEKAFGFEQCGYEVGPKAAHPGPRPWAPERPAAAEGASIVPSALEGSRHHRGASPNHSPDEHLEQTFTQSSPQSAGSPTILTVGRTPERQDVRHHRRERRSWDGRCHERGRPSTDVSTIRYPAAVSARGPEQLLLGPTGRDVHDP